MAEDNLELKNKLQKQQSNESSEDADVVLQMSFNESDGICTYSTGSVSSISTMDTETFNIIGI